MFYNFTSHGLFFSHECFTSNADVVAFSKAIYIKWLGTFLSTYKATSVTLPFCKFILEFFESGDQFIFSLNRMEMNINSTSIDAALNMLKIQIGFWKEIICIYRYSIKTKYS